ncbi:hypothetical protein [Nannocystis radixulma]|uniref:Uncharacterized protein n=1 Tax=Nannocystis radixulma TaxID=2995305 RepID=A0ABT5BDA6_9BACT|nr:hypothetical protein [Nannocystis radixulma]MDC0672118.1 hypothetical protein [Nannocystis radixulma]
MPPSPPDAAKADDWVVRAVESAGDGPAVILVLDAQRWPTLYPHLRALAPHMPAGFAAGLDAIADPSQWLRVALKAMQVDVPTADTVGWDRSRPLVFALFEPPHDGPVGTIAAGLPLLRGAVPNIRHQIIAPATDPAALTRSLASSFAAHGLTRPAWAHEGQIWGVGESGWVALVPEVDAVRVIVASGGLFPPGFFAERSHARYRGDPTVRGAAAPRTAGVASMSGDAIGLLVRPQKYAALRTWEGALQLRELESIAAPDQIVSVRQKQLEILAGCEVVYGNEAPEVDDVVLGLAATDDALRLRAVASLTPRGAAAVDRAATGVDVLAVKRPDPPASGWWRFGLKAAWEALGEPASPLPAGFKCHEDRMAMNIAPAAALGNSLRYRRSLPATGSTSYASMQFVVTEASSVSVKYALAFLYDGAAGVPGAGRNLDGVGGVETRGDIRPEGSRHRLRLGDGSDPNEVFGAPESVAELGRLHVDLAGVAPALQTDSPPLAAALRPFRRIELLAERSGPRALTADLVFALHGDPKPRSFDRPAFDWTSPTQPGDRACSQRYGQALVAAIRTPDEGPFTGEEVLRRVAAFDDATRCLADHPTLAASEAELRRLPAFIHADRLAALLLHDDAARVLAGTCARGDSEACARQDALRAAIAPRLPEVSQAPCDYGFPLDANYTIAVSAAGLSLDGVKQAEPAALRSAMGSLLADMPADYVRTFGLGIDRDMSFGSVRPLLEALRGTPHAGFSVLFRGPEGRLHSVPILLEPVPRDSAVTRIALGGGARAAGRKGAEKIDNLQVSATDEVPWKEVAAALARSCSMPLLLVEPSAGPKTGRPARP